jgi:hypothetical protein
MTQVQKKIVFLINEAIYNAIKVDKEKCAKYKEDSINNGRLNVKKIKIQLQKG